MGVLTDYEPKEVMKYFEKICSIPHPSGQEMELSNYLVEFAKERNLEYYQDDLFNVIIYKKATSGLENKDTLILQAHIDMVTVADEGYDFSNGVQAYVEGDLIKAKGTSLGADDGIGVAYILAILASENIEHPALECVFTTSEEVGLDGAAFLDLNKLSGKKLINLDSEEENNLVIGCAGGCKSEISFDYKPQNEKGVLVEISIEGLAGGHSGVEIHKGRANANVLLGRFLYELSKKAEFYLVSAEGGTKDNVITLESKAKIIIKKKKLDILEEFVGKVNEIYSKEYHVTEPDMVIKLNAISKSKEKVLTDKDFMRLMVIMNNSSFGPIKMRQTDLSSVETSLNLGILRVGNGHVSVSHSVRSNIDSGKEWQKNRLELLAYATGSKIKISGEYPAWEAIGVSDFANYASKTFTRLFGREMKVFTEHAGLECAMFCSKDKEIQAISIGPDLSDVHTSSESASIESINNVWKFIVELLKG